MSAKRIVGVTPLGRMELAGGPHTLRVIKSGFVTWARDIQVDPNQPTVVEAGLVEIVTRAPMVAREETRR